MKESSKSLTLGLPEAAILATLVPAVALLTSYFYLMGFFLTMPGGFILLITPQDLIATGLRPLSLAVGVAAFAGFYFRHSGLAHHFTNSRFWKTGIGLGDIAIIGALGVALLVVATAVPSSWKAFGDSAVLAYKLI